MSNLDGSVPGNGRSGYETDYLTSFVHELIRDYAGPGGSMYFRGSEVDIGGAECRRTVDMCMIAARVPIQLGSVIHLAGYSRGGAIAIAVAQHIATEFPNVRIPVMALFDAVDWELGLGDLKTIPGNVEFAFHALRDHSVNSRWYFGNCGTKAAAGCKLEVWTFKTTHGGMGGTPLGKNRGSFQKMPENFPRLIGGITPAINVEMEKAQSDFAQEWMWTKLREKGIVRSNHK
jgi:hypothetical protein